MLELLATPESTEIIEQFNNGVGFIDAQGRRVLAVGKYVVGPALITGEDEDQLAVKLEGVDYYSPEDDSDDFWDVVVASTLKRRSDA